MTKFKVGDIVKVRDLGAYHKPYSTQIFKIIGLNKYNTFECTTNDYVDTNRKSPTYKFNSEDLYLYNNYNIEELIKNLEKLEKRYER